MDCAKLEQEVSKEEIKEVLFRMLGNKSSGLMVILLNSSRKHAGLLGEI